MMSGFESDQKEDELIISLHKEIEYNWGKGRDWQKRGNNPGSDLNPRSDHRRCQGIAPLSADLFESHRIPFYRSKEGGAAICPMWPEG